MPALARVGRDDDLARAVAPRVEDAVDGRGREVRPVREADDRGLGVRVEGSQAAAKRRSGPPLPLAARDDAGALDVELVRAGDDDDVVDARSPETLEDAGEEEALLRPAEARPGSGGEDDRRDAARRRQRQPAIWTARALTFAT